VNPGYGMHGWGDVAPSFFAPRLTHGTNVQVVLPTPHRRSKTRRTPVSFTALTRSTWKRPAGRDLVFTPLPFTRVFSAWLAAVVAIGINEAIRMGVLVPLVGSVAGGVVGTALTIASILAVTRPFFRPYSGQWADTLAWDAVVLAAMTVFAHTLFALYVQHHFGYEILARYNILRGELWLFVVVAVAITPFVWTRWSES
jgi:hypothetical protein